MRRLGVGILIAAVCLTGLPAVAADSLDDIQKKVEEAWAKHTSMTGTIAVTATVPLGQAKLPVTAVGPVEYLKKDGQVMYREQLTATVQAMSMEAKVDVVFDGTDLCLTTEFMGKKNQTTSKPALSKGAVPPGGGSLIGTLKQELELTPLEDGEVDGKPVYVIQGTPKAGLDVPFEKVHISLEKETGALLKGDVFESGTVSMATISLSNIKWDEDLNPALFVCTPPAPDPPAEEKKPEASEAK